MAQVPGATKNSARVGASLVSRQQTGLRETTANIMHARMADLAVWSGRLQRLQEVAERAQRLTVASGAAIALAEGGKFVCRASSGVAAPEPGTQLDVQSGLSGECIRSCTVVRCDDANRDSRANAIACKQLGIRALLAVPIRVDSRIVGVLEVFSTSPSAFSDVHAKLLTELAALVPECQETFNAGAGPPKTIRATNGGIPSTILPSLHRGGRVARYAIIVGAAPASIALLFYLVLHTSPAATVSDHTAVIVKPSVPAGETVEQVVASPVTAADAGLTRSRKVVHQNPTPEREPTNKPALMGVSGRVAAAAASLSDVPQVSDMETPPILRVNPAFADSHAIAVFQQILKLPVTAVKGPQLRVSTGVTEPVLVQRVLPEYPRMAKAQHVEGAVVLNAVIGKDGAVRDVRAISGNGLLARAAINAVKYWRYRPSHVDGEPIEMQTRITLNFTLDR